MNNKEKTKEQLIKELAQLRKRVVELDGAEGEHQRAEEAIHTSEPLARKTVDALSEHIALLDEDGLILTVNEAWRNFARSNAPSLEGLVEGANYLRVCDHAQGDDAGLAMAFAQGMRSVVRGERELFVLEYPCHSPDEKRWFIGRATRVRGEGPVRVVTAHHNITQRKLDEEALRESEECFRKVFHASPMSIAITRLADNQLVGVNARWQNLTGFTREEVIGRTPEELKIWVDFGERDQLIRRLGEQGAVRGFEFQIRQKSGDIRHLIMAAELVELSGEPSMLSMAVDITERKLAEAQFCQLQKADSLGRMAGAIAHHFNNQLGVVIGNLELARIDLPSGSGVQARLAEAMKASHRVSEVSVLLLTYLGQAPGEREQLDLSEVCRRNLSMLRAAMPKNVAMETDLPSLGPAITANANQILQVLTNLLTNAWEAVGDAYGAVHLRVKTISSADIPAPYRYPISWQPDDNPYACLEVEDTGCGIADQDIGSLFDPFFSKKLTGRGLGLPAVLGILKAHRGAVTVESEPGRGSVFRVFFPMSAVEVPQQPARTAQAPTIDEGGTVLLVDDEPALRRMAAEMLTRLGFKVLEAEDGVEAVEVFRQHQDEIRCLFCDLTMPRMDGWETLETIRALRPDIPVVLASGYDEARAMEGKRAELPQAFLHKPYTMAELKAALDAAMGASSAESVKPD
jgi:PAS domain S-box-containing protein